jgi:hypothetical protein
MFILFFAVAPHTMPTSHPGHIIGFPRSLNSRSVNDVVSHDCISKLHFFTMIYAFFVCSVRLFVSFFSPDHNYPDDDMAHDCVNLHVILIRIVEYYCCVGL